LTIEPRRRETVRVDYTRSDLVGYPGTNVFVDILFIPFYGGVPCD
jgi:hypothetical protein